MKFDENIYRSLQWYEKQVGFLRGQLKLIQYQNHKELKSRVFEKINHFAKNAPVPSEPLTEEEAAQWKILSAHSEQCRELVDLIEQKVENERREQ